MSCLDKDEMTSVGVGVGPAVTAMTPTAGPDVEFDEDGIESACREIGFNISNL